MAQPKTQPIALGEVPPISSEHEEPTLDEIIKFTGFGDVGEVFRDDSFYRQEVTKRAVNNWYDSDFKNEYLLRLVAIGHTIEANQPNPDPDFLEQSIGRVMIGSEVARPSLIHVVPAVTELLPKPTAEAYLLRMLADPDAALDGWFPVQEDVPTVIEWRFSFGDKALQKRLEGQLNSLYQSEPYIEPLPKNQAA